MDAVGNISNASSTVNVTTNAATPGVGSIIEKDPSFRNIVPSGAKIEKVAGGFKFTEGPIWVKEGAGYLLFSDIGNDAIMKWTPSGTVSTFRKPSDRSNGLTLDKQGRLIICDQANRRMSRLEPNGTLTVLASTYQNRRFNSPNDAVYGSEGSLYFTDPPYGLSNPSLQELNFQGVFRLAPNGTVQLLVRNLSRPNGIALSPDEKTLYVANSDSNNKVWMAYTLGTTGGVSNGRVFYNASQANEEGLPDGLKVDIQGNLYCTGPGGVWVFSPQGTHLGTIKPPEVATNCHWGDQDGKTLYITATTGLYRIRLNIQGIRP
jgi:gluconolactonase